MNNALTKTTDTTSIKEIRKILGKKALTLSDEQIKSLLAVVDFMVEGWLDSFEVNTFGKTINDLTSTSHKL